MNPPDSRHHELFSTAEDLPKDHARIMREVEPLHAVDGAALQREVERGDRGPATESLGHAFFEKSLALLRIDGIDVPDIAPEPLAGLTSGQALASSVRAIFSDPERLASHFRGPPDDGAEAGFYSFPLNSVSGGVRTNVTGSHAGLPTSLVWNHNARTNPAVIGLERAQGVLDAAARLYSRVTSLVVEALSTVLDDEDRYLETLVGSGSPHRANHLKLIRSPGAPEPGALQVDPVSGMVVRHRVHVDHCVLTLNPPTAAASSNGGEFFYLSARDGERSWRPLVVPPHHVVVFAGYDLATFTAGSDRRIHGLAHQVLATVAEARCSRTSVLFRLAVDPDSTSLRTLTEGPFTFHGHETGSGPEYYSAVRNHRRGY